MSSGICGNAKYKGVSTGGVGLVYPLGTPSNVVNQTASQTTVNLLASTPAGRQYEVEGYVDEKTPCTNATAGSVAVNVSWTDATTSRTKTITLAFDTSSAAASFQTFAVQLFANSGTAISYTTTYTACTTGTAAYDLHATVVELQ